MCYQKSKYKWIMGRICRYAAEDWSAGITSAQLPVTGIIAGENCRFFWHSLSSSNYDELNLPVLANLQA